MKYSVIGVLASIGVAFLPFVTSKSLFYAAVNVKYFFIVGLVYLIALWCIYLIFTGKRTFTFKSRFLLISTAATLIVFYIASFVGVFPEKSLWSDILRSSGVLFLTHIFLLSFLLGEFMKADDWKLVRRAIAISGGVFALLTFLGPEGFGLIKTSGGTLGNSTFAGAYLVLSIIITFIELSLSSKGTVWRRFLMSLGLVQFLSPLLINSKLLFNPAAFQTIFSNPLMVFGTARSSGATVLLAVLFLLGWVAIKRFLRESYRKNALRLWSGLWILGMLSGIFLLFTPNSIVQNKYIESSTGARILVWNSGIEAFKEKPILGWGPENFDFAFQKYFDNRLYLDEYLGEVWFDRAHNIIIDTLVSVGVVGAFFTLLFVYFFVRVVLRAKGKGIIGGMETVLLLVFVAAHFLQLQTSFDTVATYAFLGIFLGYGFWLERQIGLLPEYSVGMNPGGMNVAVRNNKVTAGLLIVLVLVGAKFLFFDEYVRQSALMKTFVTRDTNKQGDYIKKSLTRISNFELLRLSGASFMKGVIEQLPEIAKNPGLKEKVLLHATSYEKAYKSYIDQTPDYYRIRMDYAYLLFVKSFLGENRILEARQVVNDSYKLSRNNPLTYAMDSLAHLYSGELSESKRIAKQGFELNPGNKFAVEILEYIKTQERKLPAVSIIKLENL